MSSWRDLVVALVVTTGVGASQGQPGAAFPGIGRAATAAEVAAWDIDVRPDFKGLPPGAGSVRKGQEIWEAKCASCHGVFGESNQVFHPLIGGTTAQDLKTGRVARLTDPSYPGRTTLMKLSSLSSLWDYINRAMPWTQPKSLSADEVYAVTGYMLHLGGIVPADFVLSSSNMAEVQARLPNRNGMSTAHGMWPGKALGGTGRPDVGGSSCMRNCETGNRVASMLPDHARDAHGNLADQNRLVGPQRGAETVRPDVARAGDSADVLALTRKHACTACHAPEHKLVGPSWADIVGMHAGRVDYLAGKIRSGSSGVWGQVPMPAQPLSDTDAGVIARWLATGAKP
jgi:cytochrome c551/c552